MCPAPNKVKFKQERHEENYTKAHHNHIAQRQSLEISLRKRHCYKQRSKDKGDNRALVRKAMGRQKSTERKTYCTQPRILDSADYLAKTRVKDTFPKFKKLIPGRPIKESPSGTRKMILCKNLAPWKRRGEVWRPIAITRVASFCSL